MLDSNTYRLKTPEGASSRGLDSMTLKPLSVLVSKYQHAGEGERASRGETCFENPPCICKGLERVFALFNGNLFLIIAM